MAMEFAGKRFAVVGLGKSGLSVVRFCLKRGATVLACDDRNEAALATSLASLASLADAPGCEDAQHTGRLSFRLGGVRADVLAQADCIVCSPGVPQSHPALVSARARGIPVTGEIEWASQFVRAPIVGITGTNGKSTVTSLCGAMAAETGRPSFCGGNLGTPLVDAVDTPAAQENGIVVVELSSFQLETCVTLRCHAAALLNVTPDHLDRYPSLVEYGNAKARIFAQQPPDATRVVSADDDEAWTLLARTLRDTDTCHFFTTQNPPPRRLVERKGPGWLGCVDGGDLVLAPAFANTPFAKLLDSPATERYPLSELQVVGRHNQANVLAALLLFRASGLATPAQVRRAAASFHALPHRMQLVAKAQGVLFYDDSKGTNVDAVVAGVSGFGRPLALIAGGRDKGGSYAPLVAALQQQPTRGVVLIGEAAPLLAQALAGSAFPVLHAPSLEVAVEQAFALCQKGDAVVLSPACSSYDMFRDYAHRAAVFCEAAARLPGATPCLRGETS